MTAVPPAGLWTVFASAGCWQGITPGMLKVLCMPDPWKLVLARAGDPQNLSPFAMGAQRMGWQIVGGKMDDISVIVAHVVPASKL